MKNYDKEDLVLEQCIWFMLSLILWFSIFIFANKIISIKEESYLLHNPTTWFIIVFVLGTLSYSFVIKHLSPIDKIQYMDMCIVLCLFSKYYFSSYVSYYNFVKNVQVNKLVDKEDIDNYNKAVNYFSRNSFNYKDKRISNFKRIEVTK